MDQWFQICNLRTTLLHLQFVYTQLSQKIEEQEGKVERAHKDRLMQYSLLWQDYLNLENSNFKKIIIIKLESCIAAHQNDNQLWQILDQFKTYTSAIEQQMQENMSKLYLGKKVLFNIEEVEQQMVQIQAKITSFMNKYSIGIEQYYSSLRNMEETRMQIQKYIMQIKGLYQELESGYGGYLRKRLIRRSKQIDKNLKELRMALLQ